ncbi:dihydroxyacetone kinase family protein [Saccharopolyspora cebuensis]|uniref:Dihydroxyacetone kinase family protein n=1 Tax=Saccharopolyspora cebuensis TaxID=418759 RepID=A0ABV4CDN8_9PSEU
MDGGVVRAAPGPEGKVAVVVGGGSGHYPAFAGLVGPGFCDGAVVGNVFTSPSAQQAVEVARAADLGGGVLFSFGNYAGDTMNFGIAQERLRAEGIDCRTVVVTDDIASAPPERAEQRRGIAGDLVVFKVAAAAAEEGADLDEVERLARLANERTRTLGIAFAGCTLPGQDTPLFTVPDGKMGLGLGIHGEPGVSDVDLGSAEEVADVLVDGVLAEAPSRGGRVGAVLNGLGGTKYEELFVVWSRVARRLREAGCEVVDPEVGELVTSLDMAGISLTLVWLDEDLERCWRAPVDAPAFRKGAPPAPGAEPARQRRGTARRQRSWEATEESRASAAVAVDVLDAVRRAIADAEEELGRIDAVAADGDHGRGMVRGTGAALEAASAALAAGAGAGSVLAEAGDAWAAKAGGTSGVLWGTGLRAAGERLGDTAAPTPASGAAAVEAFAEAIRRTGGAEVGDKTMVDALVPFTRALTAGRRWSAAAAEARQAAEDTAALTPKRGRARPLAERSAGTPDAGAVSFALIVETIAAGLEEK